MFRESLLETSATAIAHKGWATLMSFSLEMLGIATLIVVPLFIHEAVPNVGAPPVPRTTSVTPEQIKNAIQLLTRNIADFDDGLIHVPREIPRDIYIPTSPERPKGNNIVVDICNDCVYDPNAVRNPVQTNNVLNTLLATDNVTRTTDRQPVLAVSTIRVSRMDPGMLINRVEPRYPDVARRARIQGPVRIAALIGKDGHIESLHVISGHPLLVNAALSAVSLWRYRPTILNGQPVQVDTQVEVNFVLVQ